jgi:teichuronic acid biosynthesis glycosyltransferase TuaH
MSERHIAARLTEWAPVLYVDPPTSLLELTHLPSARRSSPPQILGPRLARITPVALPLTRRRGLVRATQMLTRLQIGSAIRRLGGTVAVRILASDLPLYGNAAGERRVLFATDDFSEGAELMGLDRRQIRRHEAQLARQSHLVIAVSELIAQKWRSLGCTVTVIPNGCDVEHFAATDRAPWPADLRLPGPIAGFVGQINDRLDLGLLEAVAARGRSLLLVGPVTRIAHRGRLASLLARPSVQWIGPKPFTAMPSYLRAIRVGLTPYADTPFNRASVPLKTVEYLAAGRAAVSSDLPAARSLATPHVSIAAGAEAFARAVDTRLTEPLTDVVVAQRRAFAARHGWTARARRFAEAIGVLTSDPAGVCLPVGGP